MLPKEISSLQHPIVKHALKVRTDKAYRTAESEVLIAGFKLVREVAPLKALFVLPGTPLVPADQVYTVTEDILKKITGLMHPEPIAALTAMPEESSLTGARFLLALDQVSDPGNVGTLLRTALALGWEGAFLTEGSADPFNDKALRAAKGATFRLPFRTGTAQELLALARSNKMRLLLADVGGSPLSASKENTLLVLGSEAKGASQALKDQCEAITIPMSGKMESLNVACAGAILMYAVNHG